jgi:hypothetical protein
LKKSLSKHINTGASFKDIVEADLLVKTNYRGILRTLAMGMA